MNQFPDKRTCPHSRAQYFGRDYLCVRCGIEMHRVHVDDLVRLETPSGLEIEREPGRWRRER